jgi:ubiquinone biosynthesis accessory factor UbiJ
LTSHPRTRNPFSHAAAAAINHLLANASWARDALGRHAGKTARFDMPPFTVTVTVTAAGMVAPAAADATVHVSFELTPGLLLRLAVRDERAWSEVAVDGEGGFAATVHHVARHLHWDVEEDLSRIFGDIAAHRLADAGRALERWSGQTAEHLGRSAAEYWTEEQPLIARVRDVEAFNREVDRLRDDVARLEKRLDLAARRQESE